jgi:putative NIF3 family GTP cyclohydrolase 1 type 2
MKAFQVVDAIKNFSKVPVLPGNTNDVYISGTSEAVVTGVVTTFMATVDVLRAAVKIGANMIITHEPTYFTGRDATDWLEGDPVYLEKKRFIDEHGLVIWRYHDRMHATHPDGIYEGVLKELGWKKYQVSEPLGPGSRRIEEAFSDYYVIPGTTLRELAEFFKAKFSMDTVQIIGDPAMACSRIGILVGAGSMGLGVEEMPMKLMRDKNLDVIVCGEITEWTLCAYVNDARRLGFNKALLIVGHERSEEWGMKYMAEWLTPLVPGVPVTFIDAKEPFIYL